LGGRRGVARDKVPRVATVEALIDRVASWTLNQVQLYMEHTFAYQAHREVWTDASPLTADEVRHLDGFCRDHHVELVPNQNCLGHMERWLKHERYRPMAMSPDGFVNQRGMLRPPTTIEPSNPASLALVRELLSELLRNFGSRRVHVGLDAPWELPDQRFGEHLGWARTLGGPGELDRHGRLARPGSPAVPAGQRARLRLRRGSVVVPRGQPRPRPRRRPRRPLLRRRRRRAGRGPRGAR